MLKKVFSVRNVMGFIFISLLASSIFVTYKIVYAPVIAPQSDVVIRVKSEYVLMLLQCILGIFAMLLPGFLMKRIRLNIPSYMLVAYAVFLYCAIYLGEVRSFYYYFPHWDTILHTLSGAMLGALGFSFISLLNKSDTVPVNLSPAFVAVFTFCFAVSLGVIWEVYEFAADGVLQTNMQKFTLENGELLVGRMALADTMKDLIVDALGALIISVIGYVSLKNRKGWMERFQLKLER